MQIFRRDSMCGEFRDKYCQRLCFIEKFHGGHEVEGVVLTFRKSISVEHDSDGQSRLVP